MLCMQNVSDICLFSFTLIGPTASDQFHSGTITRDSAHPSMLKRNLDCFENIFIHALVHPSFLFRILFGQPLQQVPALGFLQLCIIPLNTHMKLVTKIYSLISVSMHSCYTPTLYICLSYLRN